MDRYLDGLPTELAAQLAQANRAGLAALRRYLDSGEAVAFLGAGTSAPLYPLWPQLVVDLIEAAVDRDLARAVAATCRAQAALRPDAVVEIISRNLGPVAYQALLRDLFQVRRDAQSGQTWTPVHELVCRCAFKAVITTNYDPGVVDARMRVRPRAVSTGFTTWQDERRLDDWRTGDVFRGTDELPVLYAHGYHNQPEGIVLATTDYRRAYAGKLAQVIVRMVDSSHLVWLGFSFADQRIAAILREVPGHSGTRMEPGAPMRHVAVMAYDPADVLDPSTLADLARIEYGADLVLYPAPNGDHGALHRLLADFVDAQYPPVPAAVPLGTITTTTTTTTAAAPSSRTGAVPVTWAQGAEAERLFVGRTEELAKLDRWAADPTVRLVGVTAWGGAGKTALISHWIDRLDGASRRPGVRAVFGWSFYADPSADAWAKAMLNWAETTLRVRVFESDSATAIIALLKAVPVALVLDGLEVVQEGPTSGRTFGRLLDGLLRQVLTAAARLDHPSLVVLTSRFPFADLAGFDGGRARMLDLAPFTPTEGADLLTTAGVTALSRKQLVRLAQAVDGHALALTAVAALLTRHAGDAPPSSVADLLTHIDEAGTTGRKVTSLLDFYAKHLDEPQRMLVAAIGLFSRPVSAAQVLALTQHETFQPLAGWNEPMVRAAVRGPLAGLLSWHPDGTISAHPLVRQVFRPLALGAAQVAVDAALAGTPRGPVTDRDQALRVVEALELLLDAHQWVAADDLYRARTDNGRVWETLPAAQLGQRATTAFIATRERREACAEFLPPARLRNYLVWAGALATNAGDLDTGIEYNLASVERARTANDHTSLSVALVTWSRCLIHLGRTREAADAAAEGLTQAEIADNRTRIWISECVWGFAAYRSGDTSNADLRFSRAAANALAADGEHLSSLNGVEWGQFLCDTARVGPARRLLEANIAVCRRYGWSDDEARCRVLMARLCLAGDDLAAARTHIDAALTTFRAGDLLIELAAADVVAGDVARHGGNYSGAEEHLNEAIDVAGPRRLVPIHSAALAARARLCAARYISTREAGHLNSGRDAADAALRLAAGADMLPWGELDAYNAHAHLDRAEGVDRGWQARADGLYARLVPAGLEPDPLASVEADVARHRQEVVAPTSAAPSVPEQTRRDRWSFFRRRRT